MKVFASATSAREKMSLKQKKESFCLPSLQKLRLNLRGLAVLDRRLANRYTKLEKFSYKSSQISADSEPHWGTLLIIVKLSKGSTF